MQRWLRATSDLARKLERSADPMAELPMSFAHEKLAGRVVLVGYGRVGRRIAEALVIATPDTFEVSAMIDTARALNPAIRCVVRTHNDEEARLLRQDTGGMVFVGEQELAGSMARYVIESLGDAQPH